MPRFIASTEALEALKWFGVASMLVEHVAHFALGQTTGWPFILGRAAFPAFAVALAIGLDGKTIAEQLAAAGRLAAWGAASFLAVALVKEPAPLNVLVTFAVAVSFDALARGGYRYWWAVLVAAFPLTLTVEYGPLGVLACMLLLRWARKRTDWRAWLGVLLAVGCVACVPRNAVSLVWWPLIFAVLAWAPELPRARRWFYWIYAGQWPALALAKAAL